MRPTTAACDPEASLSRPTFLLHKQMVWGQIKLVSLPSSGVVNFGYRFGEILVQLQIPQKNNSTCHLLHLLKPPKLSRRSKAVNDCSYMILLTNKAQVVLLILLLTDTFIQFLCFNV